MTRADFEYDVAFSFNAMDEKLATDLNDLLSDRAKTFLYSERQREIAGTDGQEKFSDVYGKLARVVVVLYRPDWGETPWTRVEQTAIRNRAFDDGWDFATFIPTVSNPEMPKWFPKTRLYVGLERWGLPGAASVIEARIAEHGGSAHSEDISERGARFARARRLTEQKNKFLRSENGVQAAKDAYEAFSGAVERAVDKIKTHGIVLRLQRSNEYRIINGISPINLIAEFAPTYANVLEGTHLTLTFYKGFPQIWGFHGSIDRAVSLRKLRYSYEMIGVDHHAYIGIDVSIR